MSSATTDFTGERIVPGDFRTRDDYLMYLRHVAAYDATARLLSQSRSVLEVGSGEGYGAELLATRELKVTGIEIDPGAVVRAQRRYGGPHCRFVRFDGRTMPFSSGSFDGALSLQVIEHVDEDRLFVRELRRALATGGVAVLTTPNAALRLRPGQRPWNRYHVREYSANDLAKLLRTVFQQVEIRGLAGSPELYRIEATRLRRIRRIDRLDPLRLRSTLPEGMERRLRSLLRRLAAGGSPRADISQDWASRFDVGDYHLSMDLERALDLVAICRG